MCRLVVARTKGGAADIIRSYAVCVDGEKVARVRRGRTVDLTVAAGDHDLQLKIDWCVSGAHSFTARPGETAVFGCAPYPTVQLRAIGLSCAPGEYIALGRIEDPAQITGLPAEREVRIMIAYGAGFFGGFAVFIAGLCFQSFHATRIVGEVFSGAGLVSFSAVIAASRISAFRNRRRR